MERMKRRGDRSREPFFEEVVIVADLEKKFFFEKNIFFSSFLDRQKNTSSAPNYGKPATQSSNHPNPHPPNS